MKKQLLALTSLFCLFSAYGRTLTPAEALTRVQADNTATKAPAVRAVENAEPRLVLTQTTEAGLPAVYVFENSDASSLVLVSADDVATPLLGYTDRAEADATDMPPQLKWWLEEYARQIAYAQLNSGTGEEFDTDNEYTQQKAAISRSKISPLLRTTWNQDAPYNNDCPSSSNGTAYTGCTATAFAQVLNYFKYPASATGTYTATFENKTLSLDLANVKLDWANMLDSYPSATTGTTTQRKAVSQLMVACGYSVNMQYGVGSSAGSTYNCVNALKNSFGYDKGVYYTNRTTYSLDEWAELIYNNISKGCPVIYSGQSTYSGHAFVCDGYNTDGLFHFNWGWGGSYDGFYSLQALNPNGQGIGGASGGYNFMQNVVVGIQKPTGTTSEAIPQLTCTGTLSASIGEWNGTPTIVISGPFSNKNSEEITFDFYAKLVSKTTGSVVYQKTTTITNPLQPNYNYPTITAYYINNWGLDDGTYDVYVASTEVGNTDTYYPVIIGVGQPNHFQLTKSGSNYSIVNTSASTPTITYTSTFNQLYYDTTTKTFPVNTQVAYTVANKGDNEVAGGVAFQIVSGKTVLAVTTGGYYDLMPGETQTCNSTFDVVVVNNSSPALSTQYDLYAYNPNLYSCDDLTASTKIGTVTLVNYPGCTMSTSNFAVDCSTTDVNTLSVPLKATISCSQGIYGNALYAGIYSEDLKSTYTYGSFTSLNISAGQNVTISGSLPCNLESKTRYATALFYKNGSSYKQIGSTIYFTTGNSMSDVTVIESESPEGVHIGFDNATRTLMVCAGNEVKAMTIVAMNGSQIYVPTDFNGDTSFADLSSLTAGIYVVRAVDAAGNTATEKIAIR